MVKTRLTIKYKKEKQPSHYRQSDLDDKTEITEVQWTT